MVGFVRPENALTRADEFIEVGKKQRALDTLYEVIRSKKHRTWQKIHEPIMEKYLDLCVELKESHMAKDGLHQYKTICQNVNVKSLEDVITRYLGMAEQKAEKAKKEASRGGDVNSLIVDVDDLEVLNSPESLLLRAVSGESSQDRADRDVLAPWLKFVWESYKQCLDLLKNNNKLEVVYQQVAKQAFVFCVKYQRKTEFRKLCETIRQHMVQSQRYQNQTTSIDLNKPETQNCHLETRLTQLNHAISMELWQEAYKAVEDIYGLMSLSRTKPKPLQMYNYYSKLSLVFWKAGNHLFHAATLQKLFVLLKEQKKSMTSDELSKISTRLLLSTLAVPIPPSRSTIDETLEQDEVTQEKLKRLSSLLNLQQTPTRQSLLRDLVKYNVIQHAFPEVRELYRWLEVDFHPLKLSEKVSKCLAFIESKHDATVQAQDNYVQYIPALKDIAVTRLLKQVSQIYTTIEIQRFVKLAPEGMNSFHLEKLIVDAAKVLDLQVRINHQNKSLLFGNDLYVAQKEDLPEGPSIQSMPSEQIRNQLITMSEALQQAQELIYGRDMRAKRDKLSEKIANDYRMTCDRTHGDLLRRKHMIEDQKEKYEKMVFDREQVEIDEARRRQEERDHQIRLNAKKNPRADLGDIIRATKIDELTNIQEAEDAELRKQIEQATKEKKEMNERLKKEEKKIDYFVRACHEVEIPLVKAYAEEDAVVRRTFWEEKELERIQNLRNERQIQAENRERLLRMVPDKESFANQIHTAREEEFNKRMSEFQVTLTKARETKLAERKEKRKQDRRVAYLKEIEDRKRREEDERRQRDDDERKRKQDEVYKMQLARDREIEEKQAKRQQESSHLRQQEPSSASGASAAATSGSTGAYKPRSAGGSGFVQPKPVAASSHVEPESDWRRPNAAPAQDEYRSSGDRGGDRRGDDRDRRDAPQQQNRDDRYRDIRVNESSSSSGAQGGADEWRRRETNEELRGGGSSSSYSAGRQQHDQQRDRPMGGGGGGGRDFGGSSRGGGYGGEDRGARREGGYGGGRDGGARGGAPSSRYGDAKPESDWRSARQDENSAPQGDSEQRRPPMGKSYREERGSGMNRSINQNENDNTPKDEWTVKK